MKISFRTWHVKAPECYQLISDINKLDNDIFSGRCKHIPLNLHTGLVIWGLCIRETACILLMAEIECAKATWLANLVETAISCAAFLFRGLQFSWYLCIDGQLESCVNALRPQCDRSGSNILFVLNILMAWNFASAYTSRLYPQASFETCVLSSIMPRFVIPLRPSKNDRHHAEDTL